MQIPLPYDGQAILATVTETGNVRARYTPGPDIDEPLVEVYHKQPSYYHADALGSIVALTDEHGRPIRSYQYESFGLPEDYRGDRQSYLFTVWDPLSHPVVIPEGGSDYSSLMFNSLISLPYMSNPSSMFFMKPFRSRYRTGWTMSFMT